MALKDADGTSLHFTPHDFRRIFITDIVNAGFPIHLAAKMVGHNNIEVTRGYTAVYQKDVFEAYDRFIDNRRQARPSAEYREPTQAEWDEFVEHFGQRRIALGNCHRPMDLTVPMNMPASGAISARLNRPRPQGSMRSVTTFASRWSRPKEPVAGRR